MSIRVFQGATRQQLTDLSIPGTVAFLDDLGASASNTAPITAGLAFHQSRHIRLSHNSRNRI